MEGEQAAVDLLVIGGGINGVGIARDAVGRGFSVALAERGDLAMATSASSTKLVHGGLRYLEHYEFRLVREALQEREVLLGNAPHIIWPLRFVMPHSPDLRPAWMIRIGLWLYDHLGGRRSLPASGGLKLPGSPEGAPLQPRYTAGFHYADCWVDDARLVVLNALDAQARGAVIRTRTSCISAQPQGDGRWRAELRDEHDGSVAALSASMIVNAAGPWVGQVLGQVTGVNAAHRVRLVKGSHIVVPRHFAGDHAYILQNDDKRVVFAIPYEDAFTLIGTTDEPIGGEPGEAAITEDEIDYLLRAVNRYFARPLAREDVVWTYSGVRPLLDDGSEDPSSVTRDYTLELERDGGAPLLSIFGGKITTYRRLAEQALEEIEKVLGRHGPAWTASAPLPGGQLPAGGRAGLVRELAGRYPFLSEARLATWARRYGARCSDLLAGCDGPEGLGREFGGGLCEREARFLMREEWAETADDILWRRSKAGLHMSVEQRQEFALWMEDNTGKSTL